MHPGIQDYYIFLIAVVIYLLIRLVRKRDRWVLLPLALTVCIGVSSDALVTHSVEAVTGISLDESGQSAYSWVVMGLSDDSTKSAGWYDGYTRLSYEEAGENKEQQAKIAKRDLAARLQEFKDMGSWCNARFLC